MTNAMKIFAIFFAFIAMQNAQAKEPFSPDFTLNIIQGMEPPPLPQVYGIDVPDIWGQYEEKNVVVRSPLLPEMPMIMEVCAITGRAQYAYSNAQELLAGCYRGDAGLSLLELQPYEYWESLSSVGRERLMPRAFEAPFNVRVVINYRNARISNAPFKTIELGEFDSPTSYIAINGQIFQHNIEIMRAIYGMIYEIYDDRI